MGRLREITLENIFLLISLDAEDSIQESYWTHLKISQVQVDVQFFVQDSIIIGADDMVSDASCILLMMDC
ncbi:unnamed protein product [Brugia pahangi]|uniref:Ovule protein n=1 Tax=Brugia pahangi TaxID=6280 RepID=A0A0N4TJJ1_BRUPA|nr:unnamed protein product [Brugia pahangi]